MGTGIKARRRTPHRHGRRRILDPERVPRQRPWGSSCLGGDRLVPTPAAACSPGPPASRREWRKRGPGDAARVRCLAPPHRSAPPGRDLRTPDPALRPGMSPRPKTRTHTASRSIRPPLRSPKESRFAECNITHAATLPTYVFNIRGDFLRYLSNAVSPASPIRVSRDISAFRYKVYTGQ